MPNTTDLAPRIVKDAAKAIIKELFGDAEPFGSIGLLAQTQNEKAIAAKLSGFRDAIVLLENIANTVIFDDADARTTFIHAARHLLASLNAKGGSE